MSLQPSVGGGSSPRKGKCCTERTPVRTGAAPCTRVYWAGGLGTRSLSVNLPPVLVITNSATGLGLKTGSADGRSNWGRSRSARRGFRLAKKLDRKSGVEGKR